jgi:putative ABC transport system permease protein
VVILGHGIWERLFGSDPTVVGRQIMLGGNSATVIGVMPEGFRFPSNSPSDYWIPLEPTLDTNRLTGRNLHFITGVGRLRDGVTIEDATAELAQIARRMFAGGDSSTDIGSFELVTVHDDMVRRIRPALLVLMGAVGFVLLIACANVANLLLTRATSRRKEIAIRSALGAGRGRLVRQLVVDALLLSIAGGAIGLLLALWGTDLLIALAPRGAAGVIDLRLDTTVVTYTVLLSLLSGILFGLAPAIQGTGDDLIHGLKSGGLGGSRQRSRVRRVLVVGEVALSLVLLIGAGLMIRSFIELRDVDPGFDPIGVAAIDLGLSPRMYPDADGQMRFYRNVIERIESSAGIESVGAIFTLPLSGSNRENTIGIVGRDDRSGPPPEGSYRSVSAGYFRTMGIPVLRGRAFSDHDNGSSAPVVVINERLAEKYFPGVDPIGQRLTLGDSAGIEIVGVVGNVRYQDLEEDPKPEFYLPYEQSPEPKMSLLVRSRSRDIGEVADIVRAAVGNVDRRQPLFAIRSMEELVADATADRRFTMTLLALFAGIALVLASVGIYGVIAYSVAQRTHEIGLRMALGARRRDVLAMMIREGLRLALSGVGIGLVAAWGLTRLLSGLLYGVSATDPITFGGISLLLCTIALLATWIPALRAARVDPMVALRDE